MDNAVLSSMSLTSHEAHNRLLFGLQTFYDKRRELKIKHVLLEIWPTLLNSAFLLLASLLIAVTLPYLFQNSIFDFLHLLVQFVVIIILVVFNVSLELQEIVIKSLWHIKRCMSHSDNFMGQTPCPWDSSSYPTQPITTLRSQITTKGLRDRTLVNIPCSLLVKGDIIQLHQNSPSPAVVKGLCNGKILKIGETPSSRFMHSVNRKTKCIEEDEFSWFQVMHTPIIELLEKSIDSSPPSTLLYRQNKFVHKVVSCIFIPIVFSISFLLSLSRWAAYDDYFNWYNTIVFNPMYTTLLLLAPSSQIIWRVMNAYGISVYDEILKSRSAPTSGIINKLVLSARLSFKILKAIFSPYIYPLPDHVHSLGNLTAICAVDKEFLLTGGMPVPEKVFFFRSDMQQEEQKSFPDSVVTPCPTFSDSVATPCPSFPDSVATPCPTDDELSGIEFDCSGLQSPDTKTSIDDKPFYSIEIAPEIMGLSVNTEHSTGLSFDDPNWSYHLNSLKPIALNVYATSHTSSPFAVHSNSVTSFGLQHYLYKTQCSCPLSYEIGVSEYPCDNFKELQMLYIVRDHDNTDDHYAETFPRKGSHNLFQKLWNDFVQPHCVSMLIEDKCANQKLLMTKGSADIVVDCCQDFWDGKDLQPMTEIEKHAIMDFFARKMISAYCVALAYSPVSKNELSCIPSKKKSIGVYIPGNQAQDVIQSVAVSMDELSSDTTPPVATPQTATPSSLVKLLSKQVFLGMVSLQYQPKQDITQLVQSLKQSGIRFIHYTAENEVRGKLFAEKLGLEAGWNCHISLLADKQEKIEDSQVGGDSNNGDMEDNASTSSSDSSVSSVYYINDCYIKAKLPKGIEQVRSHIETVDNVPLLVPLFTDCTPDAVREMIQIMQENGEVVLCMGSAWVRENIGILAQANIGMSFTPSATDMGSGDCTIVNTDGGKGGGDHYQDWPTPMEAASSLNSLTSGAYLARDADVSLISIVQQCRHTLGCIRRGLLFFLASSLTVSLFCLLSAIFFQPLPFSGSHVFWFALVTIPVLSLSLLPIAVDNQIIMQLPVRKNVILNAEWKYYIIYFSSIFVPMSLVCLAIYWLSLFGLCSSVEYFDCDVLRGNTNSSHFSLGWQDANSFGHLLAQNVTLVFLTVYLCLSTTLFIHHYKPIWKAVKFITWQYLAFQALVVLLQLVFFAFSQSLFLFNKSSSDVPSFGLSDLPVVVWIVGLLWIVFQGIIQELVKFHNRKLFMKMQTRLKLSFETKLGMHSPV